MAINNLAAILGQLGSNPMGLGGVGDPPSPDPQSTNDASGGDKDFLTALLQSANKPNAYDQPLMQLLQTPMQQREKQVYDEHFRLKDPNSKLKTILNVVNNGLEGLAKGNKYVPLKTRAQEMASEEYDKEFKRLLEAKKATDTAHNQELMGMIRGQGAEIAGRRAGVLEQRNAIMNTHYNRMADIAQQGMTGKLSRQEMQNKLDAAKMDMQKSLEALTDAKTEALMSDTQLKQQRGGLSGAEGLSMLLSNPQRAKDKDNVMETYGELQKKKDAARPTYPMFSPVRGPGGAFFNYNRRTGEFSLPTNNEFSDLNIDTSTPEGQKVMGRLLVPHDPASAGIQTALQGSTAQLLTVSKIVNILQKLDEKKAFGRIKTAIENGKFMNYIDDPDFKEYYGMLESLLKFDRNTHTYRTAVKPEEVRAQVGTYIDPKNAIARLKPFIEAAHSRFAATGTAAIPYMKRAGLSDKQVLDILENKNGR